MRPSEHIVWPGGEHPFCLRIGELRAVEQRSNAGVAIVMLRLLAGNWWVDDVVNVIRLGLIGGGMPERDAQKLVDHVLSEQASFYALAVTAADVLRRSIMWDGDDQPGEAKAGAGNPTTNPPSATAGQGGPATTAPAS